MALFASSASGIFRSDVTDDFDAHGSGRPGNGATEAFEGDVLEVFVEVVFLFRNGLDLIHRDLPNDLTSRITRAFLNAKFLSDQIRRGRRFRDERKGSIRIRGQNHRDRRLQRNRSRRCVKLFYKFRHVQSVGTQSLADRRTWFRRLGWAHESHDRLHGGHRLGGFGKP